MIRAKLIFDWIRSAAAGKHAPSILRNYLASVAINFVPGRCFALSSFLLSYDLFMHPARPSAIIH